MRSTLEGRMVILRADRQSALDGPYTDIGKRVSNLLQVVNLPHQPGGTYVRI